MIQNASELTAILIFFFTLIFCTLFLPAFLELKRPKDNGPRIMPEFRGQNNKMISFLTNIDDDQKCDFTLFQAITTVLSVLPDMEG